MKKSGQEESVVTKRRSNSANNRAGKGAIPRRKPATVPRPAAPAEVKARSAATSTHPNNGHALESDYERQLCQLELELTAAHSHSHELEQKIAALQQSRDYYSSLFDSAPIGHALLDDLGSVHDLNQTLASMLGIQKPPPGKHSLVRYISRSDVPKFLNHLRDVRRARQQLTSSEIQMQGASGRTFLAELITAPLDPVSGAPFRFRTLVIEIIPKRRAAEKALELSREDNQRLLDSIDGIVWEADPLTFQFSFVSPSAQRLLGYPLEQWRRPGFWADHIYFEDRDRVLNSVAKAVARRTDLVLEYRMLASDRNPIWLRDTLELVEREGKLALCGVAVNVTAAKELEQRLRQAQQHLETHVAERTAQLRETVSELESFSYSLSHDMRAPLRAMQGYSQLLLSSMRDKIGPAEHDYLQRIVNSSERLDRLIRDVLTYSKLSRSPLELEWVNLEALIEDIIQDYPAFQPPNAEIELEKPLLPVKGNKAFLTQCISNLLANAVKFVHEGEVPRVHISTRFADGDVEVGFEDHGIGIRPEDQRRIFGMFQRVHANTRFEGTGIGLAIVHRAIQRMGGRVGVESAPGHGSKFTLRLHKP